MSDHPPVMDVFPQALHCPYWIGLARAVTPGVSEG
jgi:hypothetical protein